MTDLNGKDFVALVRLSNGADVTIAALGQTCERVPAGKQGTASDALRLLLAGGKIAPAPTPHVATPVVASEPEIPAPPAALDGSDHR